VLAVTLSMSSTAISLKTFQDMELSNSRGARFALGVAILQDLFIIAFLVLLPLVLGDGSNMPWTERLGWLALQGTGFVALAAVSAKWIIPAVLHAVARTRSRELFTLAMMGCCLGLAFAAGLLHLSLALGAFVAGLAVSETVYKHRILADILPIKDVFLTLFVSVGLLIDVRVALQNLALILSLTVALVACKTVIITGIAWRLGSSNRQALLGPFAGQRREFLASSANPGPARSGRRICEQSLVAASALSMGLIPLLMRLADPAAGWLNGRRLGRAQSKVAGLDPSLQQRVKQLSGHAIICGHGLVGAELNRTLRRCRDLHGGHRDERRYGEAAPARRPTGCSSPTWRMRKLGTSRGCNRRRWSPLPFPTRRRRPWPCTTSGRSIPKSASWRERGLLRTGRGWNDSASAWLFTTKRRPPAQSWRTRCASCGTKRLPLTAVELRLHLQAAQYSYAKAAMNSEEPQDRPKPSGLNFSLPQLPPSKKAGLALTSQQLLMGIAALVVLNLIVTLLKQPGAPQKAAATPHGSFDAESSKKLALKMEQQGLTEAATGAWMEYLATASPEPKEAADIWYRTGKLQQNAHAFEAALNAFYRAEALQPDSAIASDLGRSIEESLEATCRFAALRNELANRVALKQDAGKAGNEVVAEIGTEKITEAELDRRIEERIESELARFGARLPEAERAKRKEEMLGRFSAGKRGSSSCNSSWARRCCIAKPGKSNWRKNRRCAANSKKRNGPCSPAWWCNEGSKITPKSPQTRSRRVTKRTRKPIESPKRSRSAGSSATPRTPPKPGSPKAWTARIGKRFPPRWPRVRRSLD